MHYLLKKSYLTAVFSLVSLIFITPKSWGDIPATQQHSLASAVNAARTDFLQARLEFLHWELGRLKNLRKSGNATWLEVTRAEVAFQRLKSHFDSAERMSDYLDRLGRQIATDATESNTTAPPTIALQLPGSVRLVGWLPSLAVTADYRRPYFSQLHADHKQLVAFATSMLDAAAADLERNTLREAALSTIYADNPDSAALQRARFNLATAEAEHRFATTVKSRHQAEFEYVARHLQLAKDGDTSSGTAPRPAAGDRQKQMAVSHTPVDSRFIAACDDDLLHKLTRRVATLEANAEGQLVAANVILQRRTIRLAALRKLKADGFATPAELEHAERQFAAAEQLVKQIRQQRKGLLDPLLADDNDAQRSATAVQLTAHRPSERQLGQFEANELLDSLPTEVFHDGSIVRHLITLYWQTCEAEAERISVSNRLEMHREIQRRLEDIQRQGAVNTRELEFADLDVKYDEARQQAARERLEILSAEQRRFARQLQLQLRPNDEGPRPVMFAYAEPFAFNLIQLASTDIASPLIDAQSAADPRLLDSHLLQPGLTAAARVSNRTGRLTRTGLHFEPDRFRMPPELLASLSRSHPYPALRSLETDYRHCAGDTLFVRRSIFNESYSSCFAFGIRRIYVDGHRAWRSRTNSHGAPWYLPGSPTNFQ